MKEEKINKEIEKSENDKIEKIKQSIDKLKNKKSKFLFCIPETQNPSALIYELYFHASVVKSIGYNVYVLVEKGDYVIPNWVEKELTGHEHISMGDKDLSVGPEDIMIIPEIFTNVMEQTKNLPCLRIGLLQSIDYMLNSLIPGTDWSSFGIQNIITTSESLNELMERYYKNKFKIKTYDIGIPDYFERSDVPQKPVISIVGRNPNEISKLVKLFFTRFPQYSWITFDPMLTNSKPPQSMRRVDFAKRLKGNFAAVWVDRISSFGTFPLECMKSGVIPICLKPDIMPEYILNRDEDNKITDIKENIGVWTENYYDLPELIGEVIIKYLDDNIKPELYDEMELITSKYNQRDSETQLTEIYDNYVNERIGLFEKAIKPAENESNVVEDENKPTEIK